MDFLIYYFIFTSIKQELQIGTNKMRIFYRSRCIMRCKYLACGILLNTSKCVYKASEWAKNLPWPPQTLHLNIIKPHQDDFISRQQCSLGFISCFIKRNCVPYRDRNVLLLMSRSACFSCLLFHVLTLIMIMLR